MKIYARELLTPAGWRAHQCVDIQDGVIRAVEPGERGDFVCDRLVPGLFDVHCHGGEGYYALTDDARALKKYLLRLAGCGVTDLLVGVSTYSGKAGYRRALDFLREAMNRQKDGLLPGAMIRGIHLEGPFLNPSRCGAMNPDCMIVPSPEAYDDLFGDYADMIKLVTLAPERPGARELTAHLLEKGICVQAGHTDASYEQALDAFGWGVTSLCHTFNAMHPIHHRDPGLLPAAFLSENVFCEAICDFKHLHPGIVQLIYKLKGAGRMVVVSDSVTVTGLPDGEHEIGGHKYLVVDGTQRVKGGETLFGGACYLDGAVRNLVGSGIPAADAFKMASETPAARMGMADIGAIKPGALAHLAAFDGQCMPKMSVIGETVYYGK